MNPLVWILLLVSVAGLFGFERVLRLMKKGAGLAGIGLQTAVEIPASAARTAWEESWPYLRAGLWIFAALAAIILAILSVGLVAHSPLVIAFAGFLGLAQLVLTFLFVGTAAKVLEVLINSGEWLAGWLASSLSSLLSWFGFVKQHTVELELLKDRSLTKAVVKAGFALGARWVTPVVVLLVFPYVSVAIALLVVIFTLITIEIVAYHKEYSNKMWVIIYGFLCFAPVLVVLNIWLPKSIKRIYDNAAELDTRLDCRLGGDDEYCRNLELEQIAEQGLDIASPLEFAAPESLGPGESVLRFANSLSPEDRGEFWGWHEGLTPDEKRLVKELLKENSSQPLKELRIRLLATKTALGIERTIELLKEESLIVE